MSVENDDEERKEKLNEAKDEDVVIEKKKKKERFIRRGKTLKMIIKGKEEKTNSAERGICSC